MTKLDMIKKGIAFAVGYSVSHIIYGIVDNNVHDDDVVHSTATVVGKVAIAYAISEVIEERVDNGVDRIHSWWINHVN